MVRTSSRFLKRIVAFYFYILIIEQDKISLGKIGSKRTLLGAGSNEKLCEKTAWF